MTFLDSSKGVNTFCHKFIESVEALNTDQKPLDPELLQDLTGDSLGSNDSTCMTFTSFAYRAVIQANKWPRATISP